MNKLRFEMPDQESEPLVTKGISVVVPVFNEEGNVAKLHREIKEACSKENMDFEIIFVDDGSKDGTFEICKTLWPLKIIRLRRNFGQTAAMDAGIKAAKYCYIITMDGDGQNDPADMHELITYLEENDLDVVSGWRKCRKDSFMKRFASRGANFLRGILVKDGIHDSGCSLKIYRKECFENINLYGEMHRFIPALLKIKGFTVGEIEVKHRPRTAGKTKYNWKRTIKGFLDMLSVWFWHKYAVRPLHFLGTLGLAVIILGGLSTIWTIVLLCFGYDLSDTFQPILSVSLLLFGILLFVLGLMADMMTRIYYGGLDNSYSIKVIYENEADGDT